MKKWLVRITQLWLILGFSTFGFAQSIIGINDFMANPKVPTIATFPANTAATASLTLTYTANPTAGTQIIITGNANPVETYEFYSTTAPTSGYGVLIKTNVDQTYKSSGNAADFYDMITAYSNFVTCAVTTSTNVVVLTAKTNYGGVRGTTIDLSTSDADNITTLGALTGGTSTRIGDKGTIIFDTSTNSIWVKNAGDRTTSNAWKQFVANHPSGSVVTLRIVGSYDTASSISTHTIAGVLPGDRVFISPRTSLGSAAKWFAAITTNTLTTTLNATPGVTVTLNYEVVR